MSASKATRGREPFTDLLALARAELHPAGLALRALVRDCDPACVELVWPKLKMASFGVGPRKLTQHYAYLAIHARHLNLGFYEGAFLADPNHLLEGTGKALRHVKIHGVPLREAAALKALIEQAVARRRRAASGTGMG
ncbi:DUF1801 domain-containing protein [Dokdonella sp.]|uniref:DUF1801 domain-containing protein n=1 Tax=Dokdonella sp. TaxID=2291710 RepID=UPI0031C2C2C9|nr:DUF1801 domain-containing protein [Dokdonella sp.]